MTREDQMKQPSLRLYMYLSIAAAVITMSVKFLGYFLTGSVGLFSDAAESVVNLVAALVGLWAVTLAARPADEEQLHIQPFLKRSQLGPGYQWIFAQERSSRGCPSEPTVSHPCHSCRRAMSMALSVRVPASHHSIGGVSVRKWRKRQ